MPVRSGRYRSWAADSGYLTRRLADVAQNVIVRELDCGTIQGVSKSAIYRGETIDVSLKESILAESLAIPLSSDHHEVIVAENQVITETIAEKSKNYIEQIRVPKSSLANRLSASLPLLQPDMSTSRMVEEAWPSELSPHSHW